MLTAQGRRPINADSLRPCTFSHASEQCHEDWKRAETAHEIIIASNYIVKKPQSRRTGIYQDDGDAGGAVVDAGDCEGRELGALGNPSTCDTTLRLTTAYTPARNGPGTDPVSMRKSTACYLSRCSGVTRYCGTNVIIFCLGSLPKTCWARASCRVCGWQQGVSVQVALNGRIFTYLECLNIISTSLRILRKQARLVSGPTAWPISVSLSQPYTPPRGVREGCGTQIVLVSRPLPWSAGCPAARMSTH